MRELKWDKTLSVDVNEIDEDHRRLVDLFNIFNHAVIEGESLEYQNAVLQELIACTVWHFLHEERLMLKYGYDQYQEHKKEHQELVESVNEFQVHFQKEGKTSQQDFDFLEHWLTAHILVADMRLGAFLVTEIQ